MCSYIPAPRRLRLTPRDVRRHNNASLSGDPIQHHRAASSYMVLPFSPLHLLSIFLLFEHDRCWFPCLDHASLLITYDVTVKVQSTKITAAFNGKLVDTTTVTNEENGSRTKRYRFVTETLTGARAVGLAVGRFGSWEMPQSPRVKGMALRPVLSGSSNSGRRKVGFAMESCLNTNTLPWFRGSQCLL